MCEYTYNIYIIARFDCLFSWQSGCHGHNVLKRKQILWRTLIGAIPMVIMAQSAANWRNTHTHMDRTHSLTHLHQHSYNQVVRSASLAIIFSVRAGSVRVSVIHPNFDMDYGIFNVRTSSFLCVRIRTGVGHTDSESAHFWLGKTHKCWVCVCVLAIPQKLSSSSNLARWLPQTWKCVACVNDIDLDLHSNSHRSRPFQLL